MESLKLARLPSCKPYLILPKLGPSLGFRPLRQVVFGSLLRNQTQYGRLMARSFANVGGGSNNQEWSSAVENEKEEERGLPLGLQRPLIGIKVIPPSGIGKSEVSESKQENIGDIKNQFLDNQLKEIKVELRKNNEEIKKLQETVQKSLWERVRREVDQKSFGVHAASSMKKVAQDALEINQKEQLNTTPENEEIKVELRKNNEEIKNLQETVKKSWESVRTEVVKSFHANAVSILQKAAQDLLEKKEAAQQLITTRENEEIKVELRKNNEEIKNLQNTVTKSLEREHKDFENSKKKAEKMKKTNAAPTVFGAISGGR